MDSKLSWGIGLRPKHYKALHAAENIPVLEIMSDNLIGHLGGPALKHSDMLAERTQMLLHGVGLNIGSHLKFDLDYFKNLKKLIKRYSPKVVSDHLCFTRVEGASSFELLPVPRKTNTLKHLCNRIRIIQDTLETQLCIENISAYVEFKENEFSEGEFFRFLVEETGCGILLDTNNLYINSINFNFDPAFEMMKFPLQSIKQIHVAGHTEISNFLFDTHDKPVTKEVVSLTRKLLSELKDKMTPIVLEWDDPKTSYEEVLLQLNKVSSMVENRELKYGS